jgi:hypothetical protein
MPETSVDENCQSVICEKEIRGTEHGRFAKLPALNGILYYETSESPLGGRI